jgi:serine/threonine protein kinase/tetratricopeptide (TPR) repeat protein
VSFDWSAESSAFHEGPDLLARMGVGKIDTFRVLEKIGAGGMGVVYRAEDEAIQRPVAIKLLLAGPAANDMQRRRFERELRALGRLQHPALLTLHASGELQGLPYMVTEWLTGESLGERIRLRGALPEQEAVEVALATCEGLSHAHAHGILHRDIKPDNVVLEPGRGPVLLDFGLAKHCDPATSHMTRTGTFAGTAGYAAPEQLMDASSVDERADVYGLGALLFCLLTGESPAQRFSTLPELTAATYAGTLPRPREIVPTLSPRIDALVARAMCPNVEDRFQTAAELAQELRGLSSPSPRTSILKPLAGVAGVLLLVAGAWAAGRRGAPAAPPTSPDPESTQAPPSDSPSATSGSWRAERDRVVGLLDALLAEAILRIPPSKEARTRQVEELRDLQARAVAACEKGDPSDPQRARAWGSALADAGQWELALTTLADAARAGDPLAELAWASTHAAFGWVREGDPKHALPALRRLVGAAAGDRDLEAARTLARVWIAQIEDASPKAKRADLVARLSEVIASVTYPGAPPWLMRQGWIAAAGLLSRSATADVRIDLLPQVRALGNVCPPPYWSHVFSELWLRGWGKTQLGRRMSLPLEVSVRSAPTKANVFLLGKLLALQGRLGSLRSLQGLHAKVDVRGWVRTAERVATEMSGPLGPKGVVTGRHTSLTLLPTQTRVRLEWEFPPGPWTLSVRGAEVDVDLMVAHDAPPHLKDPRTIRATTMASEEHVPSETDAPTSGLHQIVITRGYAWPEALHLSLELSPGAPRWTSPWAQKIRPSPKQAALVKVIPKAREFNARGALSEALALLVPLDALAPEIVERVRVSLLVNGGGWRALCRLQRKRPDPKVWLEFEAARAAMVLGEHAEAEALLARIVARDPRQLRASEELCLARLALGKLSAALSILEAITSRDPNHEPALALTGLIRALRAGRQAPSELRAQATAHGPTRHLVLRALLLAGKAPWALAILESLASPTASEEVLRLRALIALERSGEARALVSQLRARPLAPFRKKRVATLAKRLP